MIKHYEKYWPYALLLLIVAILRINSFWQPIIDVDESQFAGFASALIDGGKPYIASVDTKPLGIYWYFEAIFSIFGRYNMIAVHAVTALWVFVTALICGAIARIIYKRPSERWYLDPHWLAALFYCVFTTTYIPKYISTSIVVIMMLPLTASIYAMIRYEVEQKVRWSLLAGILFGCASLFKYQAGINLILAISFYVVIAPLLKRRADIYKIVAPLATFLIGGISVGVLFALYLISIDAWSSFWFWSIAGSASYVEGGQSTVHLLSRFAIRGGSFIAATLIIWILAAHEIRDQILSILKRTAAAKAEAILITSWLMLTFIPVLAGGRLYGHYFIQLLPALCILAAGAASGLLSSRDARRTSRLIALGVVLPALIFLSARLLSGKIYSALNEDEANLYRPIGEFIKANSAPTDSIFVWGFATPIYYFANRSAASRFLWCDWLTGRISGSATAKDPDFDTSGRITPGSWDMFIADLEERRPIFFVDTSPGNYHDYGKYPVSKYPILSRYLAANYEQFNQLEGITIYKRKGL